MYEWFDILSADCCLNEVKQQCYIWTSSSTIIQTWLSSSSSYHLVVISLNIILQGRIQDFKLGEAYLKKLRRAEGGAKMFGVFRVKNHDFTPKNHIFSKFRGARAGCAPWIRPCTRLTLNSNLWLTISLLNH